MKLSKIILGLWIAAQGATGLLAAHGGEDTTDFSRYQLLLEVNVDRLFRDSAYTWFGEATRPYVKLSENGRSVGEIHFGEFKRSDRCRYSHRHPTLGRGWICEAEFEFNASGAPGSGMIDLHFYVEGNFLFPDESIGCVAMNAPFRSNFPAFLMGFPNSEKSVSARVIGPEIAPGDRLQHLGAELLEAGFRKLYRLDGC